MIKKTYKSKNDSFILCTFSISIDFSSESMSCEVFVTKQKRMNIEQITERCFILAIRLGYGSHIFIFDFLTLFQFNFTENLFVCLDFVVVA